MCAAASRLQAAGCKTTEKHRKTVLTFERFFSPSDRRPIGLFSGPVLRVNLQACGASGEGGGDGFGGHRKSALLMTWLRLRIEKEISIVLLR